jgi:hypothetical protein
MPALVALVLRVFLATTTFTAPAIPAFFNAAVVAFVTTIFATVTRSRHGTHTHKHPQNKQHRETNAH